MSSAAQVAANIENAKLSTGPRTDAGKSASSQNSLKHGLNSRSILLPGEDEAAYRQLCEDTFETIEPVYANERELVQNLCDAQWRISRCARLEAAILSADVPDFKALDIIGRHETRLRKLYSATLKDVKDLIVARVVGRQSSMKQAMVLRRADKLKERPSNFKEFGFDFSIQDVDAAINREDAYLSACKTVSQQADWSR